MRATLLPILLSAFAQPEIQPTPNIAYDGSPKAKPNS